MCAPVLGRLGDMYGTESITAESRERLIALISPLLQSWLDGTLAHAYTEDMSG